MHPKIDNQLLEILRQIYEWMRDFLLGAGAGGIGHTVRYSNVRFIQNEKIPFNFTIFIIKIISGGFIGWLVGSGLETTTHFRDFIIAIAGISGFTIINYLEAYGVSAIFRLLFNINIDGGKQDDAKNKPK